MAVTVTAVVAPGRAANCDMFRQSESESPPASVLCNSLRLLSGGLGSSKIQADRSAGLNVKRSESAGLDHMNGHIRAATVIGPQQSAESWPPPSGLPARPLCLSG